MVEDIRSDIIESPDRKSKGYKVNNKSLESSANLPDADVDGLLNWAKNLPAEDQFKCSGSSFFKKGII